MPKKTSKRKKAATTSTRKMPARPRPSGQAGVRRSRSRCNVLFTCVGRRVELVNAFRRAGKALGIKLGVHGADVSWLAPAMHHVDRGHIVPRLTDSRYTAAVLRIIKRHDIDLMIPLLDLELLQMSRDWERYDRAGCRAVISGEDVIETCQDKILTYQMLSRAGIDAPATWTYEQVLARDRHRFPYFMKPREGSAGQGNYKIHNVDELRVLGRRVHDPIVQEFVPGVEHTLDVYTGLDGMPRCVVPRRRIEVRGGEVSKGVVVKDRRVMAVGRKVALALENCRGVVTVQCMVADDGRIRVIEINPRFGGGAPLAIEAGADMPRWLLADHLGMRVRINPAGFKHNLAMLHFDDSVFFPLRGGRAR